MLCIYIHTYTMNTVHMCKDMSTVYACCFWRSRCLKAACKHTLIVVSPAASKPLPPNSAQGSATFSPAKSPRWLRCRRLRWAPSLWRPSWAVCPPATPPAWWMVDTWQYVAATAWGLGAAWAHQPRFTPAFHTIKKFAPTTTSRLLFLLRLKTASSARKGTRRTKPRFDGACRGSRKVTT